MTPEQLRKLSDSEKRVKIAEACGWTKHRYFKNALGDMTQDWIHPIHGSCAQWELPDYLGSLDAMHSAEKVLTQTQRHKYLQVLDRMFDDPDCIDWPLVHATAAQRADAFLAVIAEKRAPGPSGGG